MAKRHIRSAFSTDGGRRMDDPFGGSRIEPLYPIMAP
jgi:hypothetical protein